MPQTDTFSTVRDALLRQIVADAAETANWTGRPQISAAVIAAMRAVPRHAFVAERDLPFAYDNRPLAIGFGQTISQPFIVALMTDLLDLHPTDRVLEIGTGCGYQAAVLAQFSHLVHSIEVVPTLATAARARLAALGTAKVQVHEGDGFQGWPDAAPFEAIIVTAAPPAIPPALIQQLCVGGRLVIPVGPAGQTQMLCRCCKRADGTLAVEERLPVAFVPMVPR
jgi:protein-L-isoaspartate(D-aspartate) O-methyltransferase